MSTSRRRRVSLKTRRALVLSHRWIGLIGGLLVVIVSTSGALLVYQPELVRALHPEMFHSTPTDNPVGFTRAIAEARSQYPGIQFASASLKDGVYLLRASPETHDTFFVDAGTGVLNGRLDLGAGILGFLVNMHDCGFTCEGYSGYLPFLAQPCTLGKLSAFSGLSWGSALLACAAAVLLLLVLPAPFIWWKAIRKLRNALRVRWGSRAFRSRFRPARGHRHRGHGAAAHLGSHRITVRSPGPHHSVVLADRRTPRRTDIYREP
ncbi:hypothetical protein E3G47_004778 [Mycobacteroides abscessus]|nr:hypothetical protein [Mycobacteroides abscessus]